MLRRRRYARHAARIVGELRASRYPRAEVARIESALAGILEAQRGAS
jgi:hypothetical protein